MMATLREKSHWYRTAEKAIAEASREWSTTTGVRWRKITKLQAENLVRAVDKAYPFGAKRNHPDKVWLKCRREFMNSLTPIDIPEPIRKFPDQKTKVESTKSSGKYSQISLFPELD